MTLLRTILQPKLPRGEVEEAQAAYRWQTKDWIAVFVLISPFVLVISWIGDLFGS